MKNQLMVAIFVALGAVLVTRLVTIPAMEQAFADNENHFGQTRTGNNGEHLGQGINT